MNARPDVATSDQPGHVVEAESPSHEISAGGEVTLLVLVDDANVPHARVSVGTIIEKWLATLSGDLSVSVATVCVRAYGGWYVSGSCTDERWDAASRYQDTCPSILRVDNRFFRIAFKFADTILADDLFCPGRNPVMITHTGDRSTPE